MTSEDVSGGGISGWVWAALAGAAVVAVVLGFVLFGGGDEEAADATTTTQAETTTTTEESTTTTEATTTTTEETTTTEATTTTVVAAEEVPATPVVGALAPYPPVDAGAALLPDPVEAHWYQYEGLYVVLYRGFDASSGQEICAGNSIAIEGVTFSNVTNSPHLGSADEICVGTAKIAEPPSGVYACDTLLYYLTEIPTESEGTLFGTLEIGKAELLVGQSSPAATDLAATPEFVPNLVAYDLPPSGVDPGGVVTCG
jgi:hypothetical protein